MTALAVLKLQEQGHLKLSDPVRNYLPWVQDYYRNVTLNDLLLHRAELPRGELLKKEPTLADVKQMLGRVKIFCGHEKAHNIFKYSNLGYVLLGIIIEQISGAIFTHFVKRNIFLPLGMTNSGFGTGKDTENITEAHALTYFSGSGENAYNYKDIPLIPAPAASFDMFSNPADFLKLLSCILNKGVHGGKSVFTRASMDILLSSVCPASHGMDCGMGFFRINGPKESTLFQNGEHWGHSAAMLIAPERNLAFVLMVNRGSAGLDLAFMLQNINRYFADTTRMTTLNFNYSGTKKITGIYVSVTGTELAVTELNNALYISVDRGDAFPLIYKGQQYFHPVGGPLSKYFLKIDLKDGRVRGFCAGPLYFSINQPSKNNIPIRIYDSITGIYICKRVGRVALYERKRQLILAYSPFKEAVLTEIIGGVFNQATGPFVGERVAIDISTQQMRIGELLFVKTKKQY